MQASAAASSRVHPREETERALRQQDKLYSSLGPEKHGASAEAGSELAALHVSMHTTFR